MRLVIFVYAINLTGPDSEDYTCERQILLCLPGFLLTSNNHADNIASTTYWTLIETSLAIVSACLPTLWPLIQSWSPNTIIHGFHRTFCIRSDGEKVNDGSFNAIERKDEESRSFPERPN